MNDNDNKPKMLQFLRIGKVYDNKDIAINALNNIAKSYIGRQLMDGTPVLARYNDNGKTYSFIGVLYKDGSDTCISIFESRDDIYNKIEELYDITGSIFNEISNIKNDVDRINEDIATLKEVDQHLQEQIDELASKKIVVEANPSNDYISVSSNTSGNTTTFTLNESHEFDMGVWGE